MYSGVAMRRSSTTIEKFERIKIIFIVNCKCMIIRGYKENKVFTYLHDSPGTYS